MIKLRHIILFLFAQIFFVWGSFNSIGSVYYLRTIATQLFTLLYLTIFFVLYFKYFSFKNHKRWKTKLKYAFFQITFALNFPLPILRAFKAIDKYYDIHIAFEGAFPFYTWLFQLSSKPNIESDYYENHGGEGLASYNPFHWSEINNDFTPHIWLYLACIISIFLFFTITTYKNIKRFKIPSNNYDEITKS